MTGRLALTLTLAVCGAVVCLTSSPAAACTTDADLLDVATECEVSAEEVEQFTSAPSTYRYSTTPMCAEDRRARRESCSGLVRCSGAIDGVLYHVWRQDLRRPEDDRPWMRVGQTCVGENEAESLGVITPGLVQREMEKLTWPKSELVIQPPDGVTLVNLPTNFYTENTAPTRQSVDLLGQRVEIEASPTSYVWRFSRAGDGDGREGPQSRTTTSPGAPYPDLDVTYAYRYAPVTMSPSVDTVYTGRYRVNRGPWQEIPETLTVEGEPQTLQVKEAAAQLVSP